jgi:hypothetical protein
MRRGLRIRFLLLFVSLAAGTGACQSPTDPDDTPSVDDFLVATISPSPAIGNQSSDGRTYRVVRGNNQPDDILPYDWKTSFTASVTLNDKADDDDYLEFPVDLTSATISVKQASGGIVTPPTGGDTEHSDYVVSNTSSNRFATVNTTNTLTFDVWYDVPSLRREALITVQLTFKDTDGLTFSKSIDVLVAP